LALPGVDKNPAKQARSLGDAKTLGAVLASTLTIARAANTNEGGTYPVRPPFSCMSAEAEDRLLEGISMRNLLLAGTAGLLLTIGVASAANSNVPTWSPLSINTDLWRPMHRYRARTMKEGRAAHVKTAPPDQIFSDGSSDSNHLVNPDIDHSPANVSDGANEAPMADQ
jgi:hypothetical protein